MKALPSIAFNDFSGTAGNVTARSTSGGTILSVRPFPCKVYSQSQRARRNALASISRAYKKLTEPQMKEWAVLAEKLKGTSVFGKSAELTAHNAFVRVNSNRQMLGQSLLTDAPDYQHSVPTVTYDNILITTKRVLISGIQSQSDDLKLVVKMSAGQSPGVSSAWNTTVIITPGISDDWGDAALTKLYNSKIGFLPKEGEKVFIELCWIDPDSGMTGQPERTMAVCTTEEQAKTEGFVERTLINNDNIREENGIKDFKIEFTPGSSFVATEAYCTGMDGIAASKADLNDIPDGIEKATTYIVGRGPAGNKYAQYTPQTAAVWVNKSRSGEYITYAHRGGNWEKPVIYFGTGVMIQ